MIFSISGHMGSGKDLSGKIIQYLTGLNTHIPFDEWIDSDYDNPDFSDWKIVKFADALKECAAILLGCDRAKFEDPEFKNSTLPEEWDNMIAPGGWFQKDPTVRNLLQYLGTDAIRNHLHPDAWVNALMNRYSPDKKWIVTDTRFYNEILAIKSRGGIAIRISRLQNGTNSKHVSETALDEYTFDYDIENNGTKNELVEKVKAILLEHGIIP